MAGLEVPTTGLRITGIAGVSLHRPGWTVENGGIVRFRAPKRRQNVLMPTKAGRRGTRGVRDQLDVSLRMAFFGDSMFNGSDWVDQPNELLGLATNLAWFQDNVVDAEEDDRGTVASQVIDDAGVEHNPRVQVNSLIGNDDDIGVTAFAVLSLTFPSGLVL